MDAVWGLDEFKSVESAESISRPSDFINEVPPESLAKISHLLLTCFDGAQLFHGLLRPKIGGTYMKHNPIDKRKGMVQHQVFYIAVVGFPPAIS